jgi:shikimate kinase
MKAHAVFLVGFMAAGKSTVGKEFARLLGWNFVDLDTRIESRERQTVPQILRDRGEREFRLAETAALTDLINTDLLNTDLINTDLINSDSGNGSVNRNTVIALGGGAFVQEVNRQLLLPWPTVFLDAPVSELWLRTLSDGIERPLRTDPNQFARLYAERLPFYRQATVTIVTSGKDPASLCDEIRRTLQCWGTTEAAGSSQASSAQSEKGEPQ